MKTLKKLGQSLGKNEQKLIIGGKYNVDDNRRTPCRDDSDCQHLLYENNCITDIGFCGT